MGGKRDFYVIEPVGVPFREYLSVNRQALSEENEFLINVVFTQNPQTPGFKPQTPFAQPQKNGPAVIRRQAI
jgi:hypothetical protein